jgi:SPASM domain peptide maturase of grasp-with-spasm system
MKSPLFFKLFACCLPVKGAERAMICDIQRQNSHFIPLGLYEILTKHNGKTVSSVQAIYHHEYDEIIEEYVAFLEKEEYIFFTDTPELFPSLDLKWDAPFQITNAIIDLQNNFLELNWGSIIQQFEELGCKHLQIRCFSPQSLSFFEQIMQQFENKRIVSVEWIMAYQSGFDKLLLFNFCQKYPRISAIYVHGAPKTETLYLSEQGMGHLFFIETFISSESHCGIISADAFSINIQTFTEAQLHNTCLNRKISIDKDGYIKNCPSMKQHYGNIRDTTLQQALEHPDFKKYWNVHKDQIKICKDCEFRYICTDCRAYVEDPQDMYSKPLKCGYNPYTCEWEEWSTNPLKQKAIDHYNLRPIL